ncbi:coatomer subunit beta-like protein [Medicago truncatula]|uniref:Coatomer subunit beta-like protein n=1 Tax=Medicago truncatula TaxID=3880 RepID=G7IJD9_MEDTR|nr:coatomer subunit beta-like protein [Medicago truncatula]
MSEGLLEDCAQLVKENSIQESSFALKLLHNTGDEIRKGCLQSCWQNIMKMIADKQRHKTKEIKEKACISHVQLDDLKEKGGNCVG